MKEQTKKENKIVNNKAFMGISFTVLLLYTLLLVVPLCWILLTSFKSSYEFSENKLFFPNRWTFDNYVGALNLAIPIGVRKVYIEEMLLNSVIYMVLYSVIPITSNCLVAYVCAKYPCWYTKILHNLVVFFMVMPVLGGLSGSLEMSMKIGTYDNIWFSSIFQFSFGGTLFLVFYSTFKGIPNDYMEAAAMDGAGHWRIMLTIIVPMAKAIITAYMITMLIALWNDWNTALIWFPSMPTLSYGLYRFSSNGTGNTAAGVPTQCSTCVIAAVPALIFFGIFKDKILNSVSFGGLKG
ncbi:MAG: carbohydrate ABC transporter permease [Clostridia bacterium]|nr:carbohydrate ABC transporter permease [Clostridia bacterium]